MKTNKILTGVLIILLVCFVGETAYLVKLKKHNSDLGYKTLLSARVQRPFPSLRVFTRRWGDPRSNMPLSGENWDPFEEMEHTMDETFHNMMLDLKHYNSFFKEHSPFFNTFDSYLNIQDTGKNYVIKIGMPGMSKDKIDVKIEGNQLIISGRRDERSEEKANKKNGMLYKRERSFGYFSRVIPLPPDAQNKGITAHYKHGVLTVTIAKKKPGSPKGTGNGIEVL